MRRLAYVVAFLMCGAVMVGCASEGTAGAARQRPDTTGRPAPRRASLPRTLTLHCPTRAPRAMSLDVAGKPMARPGAVRLRICRYSGVNATRPVQLVRSRLIRRVALISRLTHQLNTLPRPRGTYHCPLDDGSEILLRFGYPARTPQQVIVGLTGCHFVTNGWGGTSGPSRQSARLVAQLISLTRRG